MPLTGRKQEGARDQQVLPKIKVTANNNFAMAATGEGPITNDIKFNYS